jgi:hypothetical protein
MDFGRIFETEFRTGLRRKRSDRLLSNPVIKYYRNCLDPSSGKSQMIRNFTIDLAEFRRNLASDYTYTLMGILKRKKAELLKYRSTKKYQEVLRSTEKYREIPRSAKNYSEVPRSIEICIFFLCYTTMPIS